MVKKRKVNYKRPLKLALQVDSLSYNGKLRPTKAPLLTDQDMKVIHFKLLGFARGWGGGVEGFPLVPFNSVWDCRATQARFCFPASPLVY